MRFLKKALKKIQEQVKHYHYLVSNLSLILKKDYQCLQQKRCSQKALFMNYFGFWKAIQISSILLIMGFIFGMMMHIDISFRPFAKNLVREMRWIRKNSWSMYSLAMSGISSLTNRIGLVTLVLFMGINGEIGMVLTKLKKLLKNFVTILMTDV